MKKSQSYNQKQSGMFLWFTVYTRTYHHAKQSSAYRLCTALMYQVIQLFTDEYHQHNADKTDQP